MILTKNYASEIVEHADTMTTEESYEISVQLSSREWRFTLTKDAAKELKFALRGRKVGTHETWTRRYPSASAAILHILNHLNENSDIPNRYDCLGDWLYENGDMQCPICKKWINRMDTDFARDCHGVPTRRICYKCYKQIQETKGFDGIVYEDTDDEDCMIGWE